MGRPGYGRCDLRKKAQPRSCSKDSDAKTGFERTGKCTEADGDQGSHHICINMQANTGGNFCTVTGQPDWCSSSMPCQNGQYAKGLCKVVVSEGCVRGCVRVV